MIRISGPKIEKVIDYVDNLKLENNLYKFTGNINGLQATFSCECEDEQEAKEILKKEIKKQFPVLRFYLEVIE